LNRTRCPGQDTRYWRPGDIFTVQCASCGSAVEFFKDEASRRCPGCGTRLQNPRLSMGCAQWCEHARECLGFDPKQAGAGDAAGDRSVADKIIASIRKEFGAHSPVAEATDRAYAKAVQLLKSERADPGVVLPAVLLLLADSPAPAQPPARQSSGARQSLPLAKKIMEDAGVELSDADDICSIISTYHSGGFIDSPEFRVVKNSFNGR